MLFVVKIDLHAPWMFRNELYRQYRCQDYAFLQAVTCVWLILTIFYGLRMRTHHVFSFTRNPEVSPLFHQDIFDSPFSRVRNGSLGRRQV